MVGSLFNGPKVLIVDCILVVTMTMTMRLLYITTFIHKYMISLIFFKKNFDHSSYSKYLFKNVKF
jgi:hypothetical protein